MNQTHTKIVLVRPSLGSSPRVVTGTQLELLGRLWQEIRRTSGKKRESGAFRTYRSLGLKIRRVGLKAKRNMLVAEVEKHVKKGEVDIAVAKLQFLSRLCLRLGDTASAIAHIERAVSKAGVDGYSALSATLATVLYSRFRWQLRSPHPTDTIGCVFRVFLFLFVTLYIPSFSIQYKQNRNGADTFPPSRGLSQHIQRLSRRSVTP